LQIQLHAGTLARSLASFAFITAIAGCGSGANPPIAQATTPQASQSAKITFSGSSERKTVALPSAGGVSGTVSVTAPGATPGTTLIVTASTQAPAGAERALSSVHLARTGTLSVFYYATFTPSATLTLPQLPSFSIALPQAISPAGKQFFYAISQPAPSDGSVLQFRTEGPAAVAGSNLTFAGSTTPLTLQAGQPYTFVFYGSNTPVAGSSVKHVFLIALENKNYNATFGPDSVAPYLAKTLVGQGALLTQYYGTGHFSLDNYVSMVSGQAPSLQTQQDCPIFADFAAAGTAADGQAVGTGCVYPNSVKTIADQFTDAGLTWKGYMEDMGLDPAREDATCGHPQLNATDNTERAEKVAPFDQYAAKHDPFVYFHSVIDSPTCKTNVVNLNALAQDLGSASNTPNFSFITPNLCNDGHDAQCVTGRTGGLTAANEFLQTWVPRILASPAYRKDGLLVITFDEADPTTVSDPSSPLGFRVTGGSEACCDEQSGPNVALAGQGGPGGGLTGEVLLSKFIKPGTVSSVPYNHYSQLKSLEDIFGFSHLGYAGRQGLQGFGNDIFNNE